MTKEDEKRFENNSIGRFCEKNLLMIKLEIFHCHLTGKIRAPAHINFNVNVTQKQSFFSFINHNFRKNDCHKFYRKLVDNRMF